ncbi:hypothetical protein QWY85_20955 [Neolewinella lacunae]|uniref:Uncharacterized protein n=1 Tax=Neolewinella lacunae TaxID=1517758 RepID=A0A923PLC3_9BACT|nr:hypothetical protein [Neolewinella lacunae]MBC6996197.1 hypothetical protein [Neolewinella lacunae]MDN3637154.1 hypothetical protein [Neolewinella lacunae]
MRTLFFSLLLFFAATFTLSAQGAERPGRDKVQDRVEKMYGNLNLTDLQKQEIKALYQAERDQRKAEHKAFQAKVHALLTPEQLEQLKANQAAAMELRKAQGKPTREGMQERFSSLNLSEEQKAQIKTIMEEGRTGDRSPEARKARQAKIEAVLTPEQRAQLQEERKAAMETRRSQGGGRGPRGGQR